MENLKRKLLFLDREGDCAERLIKALEEGYLCLTVQTDGRCLHEVDKHNPDVLLIRLEGETTRSGLDCISDLVEQNPNLPIIVLSGNTLTGAERSRVARSEIFANLNDWAGPEEVLPVLKRALEFRALYSERDYLRSQLQPADLLGLSNGMAVLRDQVRQAAPTAESVLITGEAGSEMIAVAQLLHQQSKRAANPFVVFRSAGLNEQDCREALFGGGPGMTATGKQQDPGSLELVGEGTLLVEEGSALPTAVQAELLDVMRNRVVRRVGDDTVLPLRARVLMSSSVDLRALSSGRRFNPELLAYLSTVEIHIPPLRDRKEDLLLLLRKFLREFGMKHGKPALSVAPEVEDFCLRHSWPGNTGEFRRMVEISVLRSQNGRITMSDMMLGGIDENMLPLNYKQAKKIVEMDFKRRFFDRLLKLSMGKVTKAAEVCGIPRPSLSTMLKHSGIRPLDYKRRASGKTAVR